MENEGKVSEEHWNSIIENFLLYVELLYNREFLVVSTEGAFWARLAFVEGQFMHLTGVRSDHIQAHEFF